MNLTQEKRELSQVVRETNQLARAKERVTTNTRQFGGALGGVGTILASIGIKEVAFRILEFGRNSVSAAAQLDQFQTVVCSLLRALWIVLTDWFL